MLTVKTGMSVELVHYSEQTAFKRQDLPCTCLAHHVPESKNTTVNIANDALLTKALPSQAPSVTVWHATELSFKSM